MIIQPINSIDAAAYYVSKDFYPYRKEPPENIVQPQDKLPLTDVVDLSAEAQMMLAISQERANRIIT